MYMTTCNVYVNVDRCNRCRVSKEVPDASVIVRRFNYATLRS